MSYVEIYDTRAQAMHREWQLKKQWDTKRKKKLIASFNIEKLMQFLVLLIISQSRINNFRIPSASLQADH
jgi:hypothetical protein